MTSAPALASTAAPAQRRLRRPRRADADFVTGRAGAGLQAPRGFAHLLLLAIAAFFIIFFAWASWAELEEVTRGDGKVIPSRQVQVVQNLEGGIVAELLAREGEIVERGQVLVRIDDLRAASELRESRQRYLALLGALGRLRAEVEDADIAFAPEVLSEAPEVAANERALYHARRDALQSELEVLRSQAAQRAQEMAQLAQRLGQLERSHAFAREELELTEPLAASRVVSKVQLLRLQREVNDLAGELEAARLAIPRVEAALREANRRIEERRLSFRAEAQRELNAVQAEAAALHEVIAAEADMVSRTEVRSPVRGTVKQLFVNTVGGVIQPGADPSRSYRSRTISWSRPRCVRRTSPSCARASRRWSRSPPTTSRSTAGWMRWSRTSARTRSPTSGARASIGCACGPTTAPCTRPRSRCRSSPA
jgi:membrane fusion protein, adhesin transport system